MGRNRKLVVLLAVLAARVTWFSPTAADVDTGHVSPEGFSASRDGLLESATNSWYATVLVESRYLVLDQHGRPTWRTKRASGVIVELEDQRRVAVIATTAHAVTNQGKKPNIRVGFDDPAEPNLQRWSADVDVVSANIARDLAFIEASIPSGSEARVARFASAECEEPGRDLVVSIGWPQLRVRREWSVPPPPNFEDRAKRFSDGLFLSFFDGYRMRSDATGLALIGLYRYQDHLSIVR